MSRSEEPRRRFLRIIQNWDSSNRIWTDARDFPPLINEEAKRALSFTPIDATGACGTKITGSVRIFPRLTTALT